MEIVKPYVPPLEQTKGQPPPIAANGGRSYMLFDRNGDGGAGKALEDALAVVAKGVPDLVGTAPPGPIVTPWGTGFRTYEECMAHIRAIGLDAPANGLALPLPYTAHSESTYSVMPSHPIWQDSARFHEIERLRDSGKKQQRQKLWFPHVRRDARRIGDVYSGLSVESPESMDRLGISLAHLESKCANFYDAAEVERVFYPEIETLLLDFFPGATDALAYNHDVFDKDYTGNRSEDQAAKNPGVYAHYADLVHNDLSDNSGRVRCRELLTLNLRNFGRAQHYSEEKAEQKMSRRFMVINLAKPMETVEQNYLIQCAWPSHADQPYITDYRIYNDRVGETTRFTYRPDHEWYGFPKQTPTEVSMLKCYDSVTDGSVSRWSCHTATIDPTAPANARCRRNIVVRAYVFF